MKLKCSICQNTFSWVKIRSAGQPPKICNNPKCKAIKNRQYYLKWKAAHPSKLRQNGIEQAAKRKKNKKIQLQPVYFSKDVPEIVKKYRCQRCGVLLIENRINCPACLTFLTDRIAGDEYIFMDGDLEDMDTSPARVF